MDEDGDCDGSGGDVVAMECDGGALAQDEMPDGGVGGSRRTLKPVARFSSLVVWNPDIPVDEGRDEYLRALGEWTRIASDVRLFFVSCRLVEYFHCLSFPFVSSPRICRRIFVTYSPNRRQLSSLLSF
jgi:hypothetical protein